MSLNVAYITVQVAGEVEVFYSSVGGTNSPAVVQKTSSVAQPYWIFVEAQKQVSIYNHI